jgi:hypothetical protein
MKFGSPKKTPPMIKIRIDKTPTRDLKTILFKSLKKYHFERTYENKVQF